MVTDQEYLRAEECCNMLESCIAAATEQIMDLTSDLANVRNLYDTYKEQLKFNREIVMRYKLQEEIHEERMNACMKKLEETHL